MIRNSLRRIAGNSLIYGMGSAISRLIGLLMLPLYTEVLTPKDYGVVALIQLIGIVVHAFLTLGTSNSMAILYFKENSNFARHSIVWTTQLVVLVSGLAWYCCVHLTAEMLSELTLRTTDYADLIKLSFLGVVIAAVTEPWYAYLRAEEQARRFVVLSAINTLLSLTLSVYLVLHLAMGIRGLFLASLFANCFAFLIAVGLVGRQLKFSINLGAVRPLIVVGFPSVFGLFAFLVVDYADRQMVERLVDVAAVGLYSVGSSFGMVMLLFVNAFGAAWPPFFMSYVQRSDEAAIIFPIVLKYYCIVFGALVLAVFAVAKPVIIVMSEASFHQAWIVIGLIGASYALKGCYLIFLPGLYYAEKLKVQAGIEWAAAIINVLANSILIPIFGIAGAASATLISYTALTLFAWRASRRYLALSYEWPRILAAAALIFVFSTLIFLNSKMQSDLLSLFAVNTLLAVLPLMILVALLHTERGELEQP